MVTDVVIPGMRGGPLAELLADKYSDKILDVRTNFLQKPFTLKSLAAKIREVLGSVALAASAAGG